MDIHLLHTNDIHSALENHMRLGHSLRATRSRLMAAGELVLTVDIGDVLDRVRPETEVTLGDINARLLGVLGYDAWVFGNNEGLTIPSARWAALVQTAETTLLATNMRDEAGQLFSFAEPWLIRTCGGIRVGMLGVTENFERAYSALGIMVADPFAAAEQAARDLRAHGCDIVVALSHLGLWRDRQLAGAVEGIDVILGGHSHTFMDTAEWIAGTAVFQAGKHALAYGHTTITYDPLACRVTSVSAQRIDVPAHEPLDGAMQHVVQEAQPEVQSRLERVVISLAKPLPVRLDGESLFANVMVDALMDAFPADIGIMMAGALTASLLPGDVHVRHLLAACSTPTRPVRLTLTGNQIFAILTQAIQPEWYGRQGIGYGFRGSVVGYLALANARVVVANVCEERRVVRVDVGGEQLNPTRTYRVVTCEFLWLAPVFAQFQEATDVQFERPLVREVLVDYLQGNGGPVATGTTRYEYTNADAIDERGGAK